MPLWARVVDRGFARGRRLTDELCRSLDTARLDLGLSYAALGAAVGMSGEQVARICRGESREVSIQRMAVLLSAVGQDLSARAFPAGIPIRDAAHVALLGRLRARLSPDLRWQSEVPVVGPQLPTAVLTWAPDAPARPPDHRAWDGVIGSPSFRVGVEAETRLHDMQAVLRRLALKQRDGDVAGVILLVNDTAHNRAVLAALDSELKSRFPGSPRKSLRRLGSGMAPDRDVMLVL